MASPAAEQRIRIEDYLNDKLQSQADLNNLDTLLESVQEQQEILKRQLQEAQRNHDATKVGSADHARKITEATRAFQTSQLDIDKRILAMTRSEVSDDAVRKFDTTMRKMEQLEIAGSYIDLLGEVDRLSGKAKSNFKQSPRTSLVPYVQLQEMVLRVQAARPGAEEAAPHLTDHVDRTVRDLWDLMKHAFSRDLEKTLQKLNWPKKDARMDESLESEWAEGVRTLLELQTLDLKSHTEDVEPLVLLPMEVMIKPLALRFKYHFEGDRPTNRLDKPEYYLSHAAEILNDYDAFFAYYLQPILSQQFRGSPIALNAAYADSTLAMVTAVLPMLREKLRSVMPEVAKQPQLLSHTIHELMNFDASIRSNWGYGSGSEGWKGLAGELLEAGWFDRWLEVEKDFALKRYQNIIESPDSGEIDFDSVEQGTTKPTKAAMRVNDLLETITDRYRSLVTFKQKLKFVVEIQLAIFDRYHGRLNEALEAFITLNNPIARKVQGFSREDVAAIQGINGLDRLCRIYGSAEYLARKMSDWSNDVFFLELWDELQYRTRSHNPSEVPEISVERVSNKNADDGALFDETCSHYERLRSRTETLICEQSFDAIREALRPYNRINPWTSADAEPSVSVELDVALQSLGQSLDFLSKSLASLPLRRVARYLLHNFQTWMWDHIVQRNNFSSGGVQQLCRDVNAIWETANQRCGPGFGQSSMKKMEEAIQLLSLALDDGDLSLREVEKRMFKNNEEARAVLEELGLDLSESDARLLLEKRIELGS